MLHRNIDCLTIRSFSLHPHLTCDMIWLLEVPSLNGLICHVHYDVSWRGRLAVTSRYKTLWRKISPSRALVERLDTSLTVDAGHIIVLDFLLKLSLFNLSIDLCTVKIWLLFKIFIKVKSLTDLSEIRCFPLGSSLVPATQVLCLDDDRHEQLPIVDDLPVVLVYRPENTLLTQKTDYQDTT